MQGKKLGVILAVCFALCPLLSGCGEEVETVQITSLQIGKDGSVTSDIVEEFGKENYALESLEAMILEEAGRYNAAGGAEAVSLSNITMSEAEEGKVLVTMRYASCDDYMHFNGASDAGSRIGQAQILDMKNVHILIIRQSAQVSQVVLPEKILYMSEGVQLAGSRTATMPGPGEDADITWTGELTYILTK